MILPHNSVYGFESIPITISGTTNQIIFDGKWSFEKEWKASSLNTYDYDDDKKIVLRSAHQDNFVYILLDAIDDDSLDVGNDYAVICFDTKNDKSDKPDQNDYCFSVSLGDKEGVTYVGGHLSNDITHFSKIQNPDGYVATSSASDNNDRYNDIPHSTYEFRIPTDLIGRESIYGFYFKVHDAKPNTDYTYPQNLYDDFVASPNEWGEIYSPDKSLPEFPIPSLLLIFTFSLSIFLSQKYFKK